MRGEEKFEKGLFGPEMEKDAELEQLKKSGGLEKVKQLIESQADVWIKRTSGAWQKVKAVLIESGGLYVYVTWYDEDRKSDAQKRVKTADLLRWQEEAPKETGS